MAKIETALISVSDKTGLPEFAQRLTWLSIHIISAGGTARLLHESGIECEDVASYTGLPEILDGRIKTLHHKVLAGLLALRELEAHRRQMLEHGIRPIDMVVVNLYPLGRTITERALEPVQALENIDIGGPTLIRAGAKNYTHVAVVTSPADYARVAQELENGGGALAEETHFALALKAFRHTARYDSAIAEHLASIHGDGQATSDTTVPESIRYDIESARVVSRRTPTAEQWADLRLAQECARRARPSSAAVAGGQKLTGLSAGQDDTARAVALALKAAGMGARGASLATAEALAPEAVELAAQAGVAAIMQSGGAADDAAAIAAADRLGLAMVLSGTGRSR